MPGEPDAVEGKIISFINPLIISEALTSHYWLVSQGAMGVVRDDQGVPQSEGFSEGLQKLPRCPQSQNSKVIRSHPLALSDSVDPQRSMDCIPTDTFVTRVYKF
jgi:hypothetical protein